MRLLFALTYYRPHISGLTIYTQRLAEALAARGHQVTVLTSQYEATLPKEEQLNGVRVVRVPVAFRVSKGAIMLSYPGRAWRVLREQDRVLINLPNTPVESWALPGLARLRGRPVVAIYHCDVQLPPAWFNRVVEGAVALDNFAAGLLAHRVIAYTEDYARQSRFLCRWCSKVQVIPPPVTVQDCSPDEVAAFRSRCAPNGERLIGLPARFAAEKGVEHLLRALPLIRREIGEARVLFAGEHERVIGERDYRERQGELLDALNEQWCFLGILAPEEMAAFYRACDVIVLPSVNRTESFGLVQVESMLCGTPVVASDLPGVRVPVQTTRMGRLVPAGEPEALARAVVEVIHNRGRYVRPREEIEKHFSLDDVLDRFEALLDSLGPEPGNAAEGRC